MSFSTRFENSNLHDSVKAIKARRDQRPCSALLPQAPKAEQMRQPRRTRTELAGNGSAPTVQSMAILSTRESLSL